MVYNTLPDNDGEQIWYLRQVFKDALDQKIITFKMIVHAFRIYYIFLGI